MYTRSVAFTKSAASAFVDLHELLRIAIGQREPRALDLQHDAMSRAEGVRDIGHVEGDAVGLGPARTQRLLEALAVLAAERLSPYKLLIAAERRDPVGRAGVV